MQRLCWLAILCLACSGDPRAPRSVQSALSGDVCFRHEDCRAGQLCSDPRYPLCGIPPYCEEPAVTCGCLCTRGCTPDSCGLDEQCAYLGGCCSPLPCVDASQCGVEGDQCIDGYCRPPGTCVYPPP